LAADTMGEISLFGGPYDGRVDHLQDYYELDGEVRRREGWPLIVEFWTFVGDTPSIRAGAREVPASGGHLVARYRLADRVTAEGHPVYEHVVPEASRENRE
jgi:hypothetical protein